MTQEAFNQIIEAARHGDVFAQTALGIMLCEGKIVQPNREHGLGWLKNAAQCNCLWARDAYAEYSQPLGWNVSKQTLTRFETCSVFRK